MNVDNMKRIQFSFDQISKYLQISKIVLLVYGFKIVRTWELYVLYVITSPQTA
jgi:hypothetical protein